MTYKLENNEVNKFVYEIYNQYGSKILKSKELQELFSEKFLELLKKFEEGYYLEAEEITYGP